MPEPTYHPLATSADLAEGRGRPFELNGHRIALVRHEGTVYAIDDLCPHADASLAFGPVENGCIACPWHYAEFRLSTGEALSGPTPRGVRTYAVKEADGQVSICLELTASGDNAETSGEGQGNP
ncbi:MAG: non-heme iron oxygenase ferredoxin subunit [Verrucomicrobiales bacterium]|nr:non-heme iron oxygenase ferredoxin subunit [Verrucomicrobiales bacterium]